MPARTPLRLVVASCLLFLASSYAPASAGDAIEVSLGWEGGNPVATAPHTLELSFSAGAGLKVPAGAVDPRFGRVPLRAAPTGGVTVAVDLAPGRERVWIDTDLDGELIDERPVSWRRDGLRWFAAASVHVAWDARDARDARDVRGRGAATVTVPVRMWRGALRPEDEFRYEAAAHRWGAALLDGRLALIALADGDGDLRFTLGGADRAYIDLDGNGALDARPGSRESVALGGTVLTEGGRRLQVDAAPDGSRVVLFDAPPEERDDVGPCGAPVAAPADDFDTLFARFGAEIRERAPRRIATVRDIGALGSVEALMLLDHVAKDDVDVGVREVAAEALGNPAFLGHGDERVMSLALNGSPRVAVAAIAALHRMAHPDRTAVYAELLDATSSRVVTAAARYLAAIDSAAARAAIVRGVSSRAEPEMRLAAYRGARSGPLGVPAQALVSAAADASRPLRLLALRDAQEHRYSRARQLLHAAGERLGPGDDGRDLLPLLARCGDASCADLVITIGSTTARRAALAQLVRMDDAVTARELVNALGNARPDVRAFAAEALAARGDVRAAGRMLEQLESEKLTFVRDALLTALSDLGDVRAIASLEKATSMDGGGGPRMFLGALGTPWVRGVPEAQAAFRLGLREDAWKIRVVALETIAAAGDPVLLPQVRDALRDEHRLVRAAAAETLGEIRDRRSVRDLLTALRGERTQAVRGAIGGALFRLTGVNLYDDAELWSRWWSANGDTFVVPVAIPVLPPAAVAGTSAPEAPKFYGIPLETESVVFVIDQSGSMGGGGSPFLTPGSLSGSKWDTAVRELLRAVGQLEDGTEVNVILFETGVRSWRRSPQRLSAGTRSSLKRYLGKLGPSGATNLYDALARALRTPRIETIVLLSDGAPTNGRFVDQASILAAVQDMNKRRGIVIHTVSIGGGSTLLRRIAMQNDGEYVTR